MMLKAGILVLAIGLAGRSVITTASAQGDDFCPWGGDRSQSLLCFECMNRVWTGHSWRLANTCKPEPATPFVQGSRRQDDRYFLDPEPRSRTGVRSRHRRKHSPPSRP